MSASMKSREMAEFLETLNQSNMAAIEADRMQDDRLGKQLRYLTSTSERSHVHASHALHMLIMRYGDAFRVPEGLFELINKDGRRLDRKLIDLKIAKKFPQFESVGDPVVLQLQFMETKHVWNANVMKAIRAAKVSTQKSNAVFSAIQLIAAQQKSSMMGGDIEFE